MYHSPLCEMALSQGPHWRFSMFTYRHSVKYVAAVLALDALMFAGCNYKGEERVAEKDLATSPTVKTAIGAAGSTFIAPIMTNWIGSYQQSHPSTLINYRPVGSGTGLSELRKNLLELAA